MYICYECKEGININEYYEDKEGRLYHIKCKPESKKKQVEVTLKIKLLVPKQWNTDEIATSIKASLPNAFGESLTDIPNPVEIVEVKEEK